MSGNGLIMCSVHGPWIICDCRRNNETVERNGTIPERSPVVLGRIHIILHRKNIKAESLSGVQSLIFLFSYFIS